MSARIWFPFQAVTSEANHYFDIESINYIETKNKNINGVDTEVVSSIFTNNGEFVTDQDTPLSVLENAGFIKIVRR